MATPRLKTIFYLFATSVLLIACKQNNTSTMQDRIAIQDLISNYAYCADNREAQKQAELFSPDAIVNVYMGKDDKPAQTLRGREALQRGFETLKQYEATMHFNGQNTITTLTDDTATGIAYCIAHHVKADSTKRTLMIMAIRYHDKYVKQNGHWYFAQRDLLIDWTDTREMH